LLRKHGTKYAHGAAVGISLALLSFSPLFLAVDHGRVFSARADLDLFVSPYFSIYVLALAVSVAMMLLLAKTKDRTSHLLFLGGVMLIMSNYATVASTSLSTASPLALLALTEPIHVGTAKYILAQGHLGEIHYYGWPQAFLFLAMLCSVLGFPDIGIAYATLVLSTVLQLLLMLTLYLLGNIFHGRGIVSVFLYYVCAFYFVAGGGGGLAGFSPQLFALPFFILYVVLTYKRPGQDSLSLNALLLLLTFVIAFSHLVTAILLTCFLLSAFLVQKITRSNTFGQLPTKILIIFIAILAWLVYFVSFDFSAVLTPQGTSSFLYFLTRFVLSSAAGQGNPYFAATTWYINLLKFYRTWINISALLTGALGFLVFVGTERNTRLRNLAVAIGFSFVGFATFDIVFVRLFDTFWERIFSLSYPFLMMFPLSLFGLMASRRIRSHTTLSLGRLARRGAIATAICMLIVMSFLASNVSLTIGYSSSEYETAVFLSSYYPNSTLGISQQFYQILKFADPARAYWFDPLIYHDEYDTKYFTTRLLYEPSLYDASIVARTNREVAFYYAAFGMPYHEFWGKIDHSLAVQSGYDRVFDSTSEQIYVRLT
jgi:hypothetical protein